jgi:deoxyribonuclease-1
MRVEPRVVLLYFSSPPRNSNYATSRRDFFWTKLYADGAQSLYCDVWFEKGQRLTIEHAYPADWIATHHGCLNRNECPIPAYSFAEADLHNLWPAIGAINSSRGDKPYGEIPGNEPTLPQNAPAKVQKSTEC